MNNIKPKYGKFVNQIMNQNDFLFFGELYTIETFIKNMKYFFRLLIFTICVNMLVFDASAQDHGNIIVDLKMRMANTAYEKYLYGEAIPLYEEILQKTPKNIDIKKRLANCYRVINDTRNAERVYSELVREDTVGLLNKLYYAQTLAENGKYDLAKVWYAKYDNALALDMRGKRFSKSYANLSDFYKDSVKWKVEILNINSPQSDFSPVFYKKGLIFCSARFYGGAVKNVFGWDQSAFLNLYYIEDLNDIEGKVYKTDLGQDAIKSYYDSSGHVIGHVGDMKTTGHDSHLVGQFGNTFLKEEDEWMRSASHKIHPFNKNINSKYHEGPSCFSANQDSIVLTRNGFHGGKLRKSNDGVSKLKIYSAKLIDGGWTKPQPIRFNKFQYYVKFTSLNTSKKNTTEQDTAYVKEIELDDNQFSISHPCLSPDNMKLFFVSDAPIGFGGTDIYVCDWVEGAWSSPINCGKNVNTEGNEMFPFVDGNGNLYFSSDGRAGLGGLDIFYSETETNIFGTKDNIFSPAKNLGFPINSKKDDFGIIVDKDFTTGFFSSNRRKGTNDDDIFRFSFVGNNSLTIAGDVKTFGAKKNVENVKVKLRTYEKEITTANTDAKGHFVFDNLDLGVDYIIETEHDQFLMSSQTLNTIGMLRGDTAKATMLLRYKDGRVEEEENQVIEDVQNSPTNSIQKNDMDLVEKTLADIGIADVEETKPIEEKPIEAKPVTPTPVVTKPVETKPVETKPITPTPVVTKPVETKPVETKPVETKPVTPTPVVTKPVETKPVETKPVTPTPVVTKPVETKPVETKPVTPTPVVTKPVETKPVTPTPVVTKPVETKPQNMSIEEDSDDLFGDIFAKESNVEKSTIKGAVLNNTKTETLNGTKLVLFANGKRIDSMTTVINGGFTFSKLDPNKKYVIFAMKNGYIDQKVTVDATTLQPGQVGNVKITLDKDNNASASNENNDDASMITLNGRVVKNDKTPVPNASITIVNSIDKSVYMLKSDASGNYTYKVKRKAFFTLKAEYGNCASEIVKVSTISSNGGEVVDNDLIMICK